MTTPIDYSRHCAGGLSNLGLAGIPAVGRYTIHPNSRALSFVGKATQGTHSQLYVAIVFAWRARGGRKAERVG